MKKVAFILIGIIFLTTSCIKDLDTDQIENLNLKPAVITPLINLELNSSNFVNGTNEINDFNKKTTFEFLNNTLGKNNVKKIHFKLNISNEIKRKFIIGISFLAKDNTIIYNEFDNIIITPENKTYKKQTLVSLGNNPNLKDIKFVEIKLKMMPSQDGSILDTNDLSKLVINLSSTLHMKI